jgi:hypothetical protein
MYYRSLAECRSWILRCLELYRAEHGQTLTYPVPNDPRTAALAILPTIEWLMGDSDACEAAIAESLEHIERLDHDFDRAYVHAWIAGVRSTQRRYLSSIEHAAKAMAFAQPNGYREWHVTGMLIHLLAQAALQPAPQALDQAGKVCAGLEAEGVGLNASWYLWALARGYRRLGKEGEPVARHLTATAFARAAASAETRMNSELLLLQAELSDEPVETLRLLEEAFTVADEQGAIANALRAAATHALRTDSDRNGVAKAALDSLDGRVPCPPGPWMQESLAVLRPARARKSAAPATA